MKKIASEFSKTKLILSALFLCIYCGIIIYCSSSPIGAIATWLLVVAFIALPGFGFAAKIANVKGMHIPKYMIPLLSVIVGCGTFAVSFCFTARLGSVIYMYIPPLLAVALWAKNMPVFFKQASQLKLARVYTFAKINANYILLWAFLVLLYATSVCLPAALPSVTGTSAFPHVDFLWNIGNAKSFLLGFPPEDIRFSGVRLAYHYFTELIWGGVSRVSGVNVYNIIMFFAPPLTMCGLIIALRAIGMFFYDESRKKVAMFMFVFLFGSCASTFFVIGNKGQSLFSNNNLIHVITNINAQATAVIFLSGLTALLGLAARKKFKVHYLQLLLTVGCFVLLSISKGPAAAIVLCGLLISMAIYLVFSRPNYLRAILFTGAIGGAFYVIYLMIFAAGANTSMMPSVGTIQSFLVFNWLETFSDKYKLAYFGLAIICVLQALLIMPLQLTLYFPVLFRDIKKLFKLSVERLLAHSCIAGGLLAYILFWHTNSSQVYFLFLALFFISLLAADFDFKIPRFAKPIYMLSGGIAVLTSICIIYSMLFGVYRPKSTVPVTLAAEQAMVMLGQVSKPSERFATNRVYTQLGDGVSNISTAISGRQAYMDGFAYEMSNMGISANVVHVQINTNAALFSEDTTQQDIQSICNENDIYYILYFTEFDGSNKVYETSYEKLYENDGVFLYKVK